MLPWLNYLMHLKIEKPHHQLFHEVESKGQAVDQIFSFHFQAMGFIS